MDGTRWDATNLALDGVRQSPRRAAATSAYRSPGLMVDQHIQTYADEALVEVWQVVRNTGDVARRVERLDSLVLNLPDRPA